MCILKAGAGYCLMLFFPFLMWALTTRVRVSPGFRGASAWMIICPQSSCFANLGFPFFVFPFMRRGPIHPLMSLIPLGG